MGKQADIRWNALESICVVEIATSFVRPVREREENREHRRVPALPSSGLSLAFTCNLLPYPQGLFLGSFCSVSGQSY